jgi:lysozyme family protein
VKVLQRALGFPPSEVDGLIGPETMTAVSGQDPRILAQDFTTARIDAYMQMSEWHIDGQGWRDRALATQQRALSL